MDESAGPTHAAGRQLLTDLSRAGLAKREAAWLEDRKRAITGTDAAMILGISPFGGAMDVWLAKTGAASEPKTLTESMEMGRRFERPILECYADRKGEPIVFADPFTLQRAELFPMIGATLDAVRERDGCPVDAKNIGWLRGDWGEDGTDKIPTYYAVQLVMQMFVLQKPSAHEAVVFGGNQFRSYTIYRDDEIEAEIIGRCIKFYTKYVIGGETPPVDGSESFATYLATKFAKSTELTLTATPSAHEHALALASAKERIKAMETITMLAANYIKDEMGAARAINGPTWRATWTLSKDTLGVDWEAVAREFAEQYVTARGGNPQSVLVESAARHQIITKHGSRVFRFTTRDE